MELKQQVKQYMDGIREIDQKAIEDATAYNASLLKIPMSLGRMEEIAIQLAGITGNVKNDMKKKCVIIMSADNGITAKGVSSAPKEVTVSMTECFTKYVTGVGVFSRASKSDLFVYDIGIDGDIHDPKVINKKIKRGTADFSEGSAMTYEEALQAILVGIEAVKDAVNQGYQVIGTGEMGIGNTSSSTAVICALTGTPLSRAVGRGAGLTDEAYQNKVDLLETAIRINQPDKNDPIDVLAKVGGLDIAGLVGVYLGAAYFRVPVVIDGYISSVAAYVAFLLNNKTKQYMIESHVTEEIGYQIIKMEMDLKPMFYMNMRLGEGSGCPFAFFAIDCANSMMNHMYTFDQGMCSTEYVEKIDDLKF